MFSGVFGRTQQQQQQQVLSSSIERWYGQHDMNTSQSVGVALSNSTGHQVHKTTHAWSRAGTVAGRPSMVYIHRILNMNLEFVPLLYINFSTQYKVLGSTWFCQWANLWFTMMPIKKMWIAFYLTLLPEHKKGFFTLPIGPLHSHKGF